MKLGKDEVSSKVDHLCMREDPFVIGTEHMNLLVLIIKFTGTDHLWMRKSNLLVLIINGKISLQDPFVKIDSLLQEKTLVFTLQMNERSLNRVTFMYLFGLF